jgi:hypothetical protein
MAASIIGIAEQFKWTNGDKCVGEKWDSWVKHLRRYIGATNMTDSDRKLDLLLFTGGPQLENLHASLKDPSPWPTEYTNGGTKDNEFEKAVYRFTNYFTPTRNDYVEIITLKNLVQEPGESLTQFYTRVEYMESKCGFDVVTDMPSIRDRYLISIVLEGMRGSHNIKKALMGKTTKELTKAVLINMLRAHDEAGTAAKMVDQRQQHGQVKEEPDDDRVNHVGRRRQPRQSGGRNVRGGHNGKQHDKQRDKTRVCRRV